MREASMLADGLGGYLTNGFLLLIPVLVWNALFTRKLPPAFAKDVFDRDIPVFVLRGENWLRVLISVLPVFVPLRFSWAGQEAAWVVYGSGLLVYFCSWLPLIHRPDSRWSRSAVGFLAPSYTPLGFFSGMALLGHSFYFPVSYPPGLYLLLVSGFLCFHVRHTYLVHRRVNRCAATARR